VAKPTLRPGGPGGPGSPEAPWGPCSKTEYLFQLVSQMYNFISIINCLNTLLTAFPGSPLSPLAPGPPSIPYNQQLFKCVFTIKMCQAWIEPGVCWRTYISTWLSRGSRVSRKSKGTLLREMDDVRVTPSWQFLTMGVVTHWVSFGSVRSRCAS